MKKIVFIVGMIWLTITFAFNKEDYLNRFLLYQQWAEHLPDSPGSDFFKFIDNDSPLAKKLREKWLYQLAQKKDWILYLQHYKDSADINLQCFEELAKYYQGKQTATSKPIIRLWLNGDSQPPACNALFNLLTTSPNFDEHLLTQRIILALDKRNLPLVRYLLKQYRQPKLQEEQALLAIYQNPSAINLLKIGELESSFYLYGLKKLISINMTKALKYWEEAQAKGLLNKGQQQAFLTHLALYKAMRNQDDTQYWFNQVNPAYYTDLLLDWQIRYVLKRQQWEAVEKLIAYSPDKEKPCWQYWLARALELRGEHIKATAIYQQLAKIRHYYGFLASWRLNILPSFENEPVANHVALLELYRPILQEIQNLYENKQVDLASRLLNDFNSELPKEDKIALVYWVGEHLQWHEKSLYLSNNDSLNNQLTLRFPLIYSQIIQNYAAYYHIPPALIYAIIRQESGFREKIISSAGAHGLMQVMPSTATQVAKQERITYSNKTQLFSSQKNINIGVAYLKSLAKRFNTHPLLMAAAYNAGPQQVNYWIKNHSPIQMDLWIETLPWYETRNYLKNVISFYTVYQYRMEKKPDLAPFMKLLYTSRQ